MSRRAAKKDITRTQILSAAVELFAEYGYEQTSIDEITKKADIAKGTFYYHFDSKEAVVSALQADSLASTIERALESLENGSSPVRVLEEVFLERAAWTEKNPDLTKVFFEQRIHQFLFRENDFYVFPGSYTDTNKHINTEELIESTGTKTKAEILTKNGNGKKRIGRFFQLIHELVLAGQKAKEIRSDIDARELTQIIIATFLHAQGSWIGGYSGSSLVDKVHRWFHAILDGLYDPSYT